MTALQDDPTLPNRAPAAAASADSGVETPFRRFVSDYRESSVAVVGTVAVALIALIALLGPLIAPTDPYDLATVSIMDSRLAPGEAMMDGRAAWLGTDGLGRDMLSAMIYGLRISLGVGIGSGAIAMLIGCSLGLAAAYYGGRVDTLIMRVVDIQLSFPAILVALILLAVLGKGIDKIIVALVAVQWAYYARTIRGSALVERRKEYVEAAASLGLGITLFAAVSCSSFKVATMRLPKYDFSSSDPSRRLFLEKLLLIPARLFTAAGGRTDRSSSPSARRMSRA